MDTQNGKGGDNNPANKTKDGVVLDLDKIIEIDKNGGNPPNNDGDGKGGNKDGSGGNNDGKGGNGNGGSNDGKGGDGSNNDNRSGGSGNGDGGNGDDGNNASGDKTGKVIVDEITYTLDENGNALNDNKEIIYTKEQLDAFSQIDNNKDNNGGNGNPDDSTVSTIQKRFGYEFKNEDGTPKIYQDSEEGLEELVNDVVNHKLITAQQAFLQSHPKLSLYYQHLANGGTDETFFNIVKEDWKSVKFDEKNPTQHVEIITKALIKKGFDPDIAKKTAELYNTNGEASKFAESFLKELVSNQEKEELSVQQAYKAKLKQQEDEWNKYTGEVNNLVLKKGQIGSFVIPEAERKQFINYMFERDANGKTKEDLDYENDPLDVELQLKYLRFKNFNLADIVAKQVKSAQAQTLKNKFGVSSEIVRLKTGTDGKPPAPAKNGKASDVNKVLDIGRIE